MSCELNLCLRVLSHERSDLVELSYLGSLDVPLADDEVDVLLELNWSYHYWLWLWLWLRFWLSLYDWSWCWSWSRDNHWSWSRLLAEGDLDTHECVVLIVAVDRTYSVAVLLRVELVAECVDTSLEVELDSVGEADVETCACTASCADLGTVPEVLE